MSIPEAAVGVVGSIGALVWVAQLAHLIRHRRDIIFLADLDPPTAAPDDPSVALIVAARDEAGGVEAAVRSMLREVEPDPGLRLVVVDDRSLDGTGAILDGLAAAHPQLRVVHVAELPDGWLGKTNALQVGADAPGAVDADWLLFTDADVVFRPGAVRRAVGFARASGVDLLAVAPEVATESVGERAFLCLFGLLFSLYAPLGRVADPRSRAHVGIGAGNLVRAEAFRAVGGFRHICLSVDDDVRLGQALKFAGYATRLVFGRGVVSVRWQVGLGGMIRGIEKNFFAGLKFDLRRVVVVAAGIVTLGVAPFAALVVGPIGTRVIAGAGLAALAVTLVASGRQSRIGVWYLTLLPIAALLILIALGRSVALTLSRGGVRWRGRLYPLADLRNHVRHRDAWLDEVWRSTR